MNLNDWYMHRQPLTNLDWDKKDHVLKPKHSYPFKLWVKDHYSKPIYYVVFDKEMEHNTREHMSNSLMYAVEEFGE